MMGLLSFGLGFGAGFVIRNTTWGSQYANKLFAVFQAIKSQKLDSYKLVLVVRDDLSMGRGKIASQCSHASVLAYRDANLYTPVAAKTWAALGQAKVVLKTPNVQSLLELDKVAKTHGLLTNIVCDAGRTQVEPGSKTVLAVGPGPSSTIDKVTGHLKLL